MALGSRRRLELNPDFSLFDIIEAEPERLRDVTGISPLRAKRINDAWAERKVVREIMVLLRIYCVGTARAQNDGRTKIGAYAFGLRVFGKIMRDDEETQGTKRDGVGLEGR